MHWNVPPDALPGSATLVRVLDRWLNNWVVYPCSEFVHVVNMGKASHKTPTSRDGWLIKTPPSDKDVILSVMTRLSSRQPMY